MNDKTYKYLKPLDVLKENDEFLVHKMKGVDVWTKIEKCIIGREIMAYNNDMRFRRPIIQDIT